ncbi:uncharacterized protein BDV17DRAFT_267136 [Aspergillus undulatus]|uniref:uncharacterized protein n=1 Tax=Aspergillus undulatus TaxID=1810928 RepID=UPI003CCD1F65
MPINVGVIGYGFSTNHYHIPFISAIPEYKITAVLQRAEAPCDISTAERGSHCTVDLPGIRHYRTPDEFFADPDTELIVVATHVDTHALFAERALTVGKHVLVDKPFVRSTEEADRVIALAKEKDLIITCYQNRRWDGDFQTLRHLMSQNALGNIAEAEFHYDFESPPWLGQMNKKEYTPGDGHLFALGAHTFDQALTLFGRPTSVTAFLRAQRGIESDVEDSYTVILQYGGDQRNLLVTVKSEVITPLRRQLKLFVRGGEGSYIKWQAKSTCPQEEQIFAGAHPLEPNFGKESPHLHGELTTYKEFDGKYQTYDPESEKYTGLYPTITGRWLGLYENLADAIRARAELEVRMGQVRDVLRVIELARESHSRGVTVAWRD